MKKLVAILPLLIISCKSNSLDDKFDNTISNTSTTLEGIIEEQISTTPCKSPASYNNEGVKINAITGDAIIVEDMLWIEDILRSTTEKSL